jgi:hypothetical protein
MVRIAIAVIPLFALVGLFWWIAAGLCGNTEAFERPSPSGAYRAVVFDRDCGATTALSTQISVLKSNQRLKNGMSGNCVIFQRETSGIEFAWKSDTELVIELAGKPLVKNDQCGGVHVTYRIGP